MKIQILPNWCKKLGLILFIIFSFLGGGDDFIRGFNNDTSNNIEGLVQAFVGGEFWIHIYSVLAIIGMLIYMLSKEKVEDDYINILRLESFQVTAIISLFVSIVLFAFSKDLKLTLDYFIILFLWFYLITFFIKKRS